MLGALLGSALLGSTALQFFGQIAQAQQIEKFSKFNKRAIELERAEAAEELNENFLRQSSTNRVTAAKSGVRMDGSPLAIQAANARIMLKQQARIQRQASISAELNRFQSKSGQFQSYTSAAGALLQGGANAAFVMGTT